MVDRPRKPVPSSDEHGSPSTLSAPTTAILAAEVFSEAKVQQLEKLARVGELLKPLITVHGLTHTCWFWRT